MLILLTVWSAAVGAERSPIRGSALSYALRGGDAKSTASAGANPVEEALRMMRDGAVIQQMQQMMSQDPNVRGRMSALLASSGVQETLRSVGLLGPNETMDVDRLFSILSDTKDLEAKMKSLADDPAFKEKLTALQQERSLAEAADNASEAMVDQTNTLFTRVEEIRSRHCTPLTAQEALSLELGQKVFARWRRQDVWYSGEIKAIHDGTDGRRVFDVTYIDGDFEAGLSHDLIAIRSDEPGAPDA